MLNEKQKTGRTTKDAVSKKGTRGGSKFKIAATPDTFEGSPSGDSASEQKVKVGVTERDDHKAHTICELCSDGGGYGMPLSRRSLR